MDVIAIAYTDSHNHDFKQFNGNQSRVVKNLKVQSKIFKLAREYDVPVFFAGDMFHNQNNLSNQLLEKTLPKLKYWHKRTKSYNISGNHDQCFPNTLDKPSPSYIKTLSQVFNNMYCIDHKSIEITDGVHLHGVPYISLNQNFEDIINNITLGKGKNILMINTDLPGAKDTNYREVGTSFNIKYKIFNRFDLVLSGHIHLPQVLLPHVLMMGSPNQQKKSDSGIEYGCYLIKSDMSWEFINMKGPEFIELENDEEPPINDNWNYYYKTPKPRKKNAKDELKAIDTDNTELLVKQYLKSKGITDKKRKKLLFRVLKDSK